MQFVFGPPRGIPTTDRLVAMPNNTVLTLQAWHNKKISDQQRNQRARANAAATQAQLRTNETQNQKFESLTQGQLALAQGQLNSLTYLATQQNANLQNTHSPAPAAGSSMGVQRRQNNMGGTPLSTREVQNHVRPTRQPSSQHQACGSAKAKRKRRRGQSKGGKRQTKHQRRNSGGRLRDSSQHSNSGSRNRSSVSPRQSEGSAALNYYGPGSGTKSPRGSCPCVRSPRA